MGAMSGEWNAWETFSSSKGAVQKELSVFVADAF